VGADTQTVAVADADSDADGGNVFYGESGLTFSDTDNTPADTSTLTGVTGDTDGKTLTDPISTTLPTGQYSQTGAAGADDNMFVTLLDPTIDTFEVQNDAGADVSGGTLLTSQADSGVFVEYNFEEAQSVTLTVEDEGGTEVTDEWISAGYNTRIGDGYIPIDPSDVDVGEYTFTVEADGDIDVEQSTTVRVIEEVSPTLSLDQDPVVTGEDTKFTVTDSQEDAYHLVTIENSSVVDGVTGDIFRTIGQTTDRGYLVETNMASGEDCNACVRHRPDRRRCGHRWDHHRLPRGG
jgi:major cell surface glycoprotein (TIGR04216 family)